MQVFVISWKLCKVLFINLFISWIEYRINLHSITKSYFGKKLVLYVCNKSCTLRFLIHGTVDMHRVYWSMKAQLQLIKRFYNTCQNEHNNYSPDRCSSLRFDNPRFLKNEETLVCLKLDVFNACENGSINIGYFCCTFLLTVCFCLQVFLFIGTAADSHLLLILIR